MLVRTLLGICFAMAGAAAAAAETVYVTDVLKLALHERSNSEGRLVRRLLSGTPLEILERKGNYTKVLTRDGLEGWTKSNYLISKKPAEVRLADLRLDYETLNNELGRAREQLAAEKQTVAEFEESADKPDRDAGIELQRIAQVRNETNRLRQRLTDSRQQNRLPFKWVLGAVAVSLLLGFTGGLAWFDYRSRKRHGGYRIY